MPRSVKDRAGPVRGSTTIEELMARFPDGKASALMARLSWPCAHCSGRMDEPLSLAAKRHGNPTGAAVEAFRALDNGGPSERQIMAATNKSASRPSVEAAWRHHADQTVR
ncbi:MAG: hypothetical protein QF767_13920 [Alphaproteobacteria bacterium]|nr:hypothetical protein [Alphaproteobacteria bacterium]